MNFVRWLYHVLPADVTVVDSYAPDTFVQDEYIHCSFRDEVVNSARLYFPAGAALHGRIPGAAIVRQWALDQLGEAPDDVSG